MPDFRPDSEDTRCLLDQVAAGDPGAVDRLLTRHRDDLRRFVDLRLDRAVRARVDPSDVVQEAQLDIARRLPEYVAGRPVPFHLWARQFAYQRVLNARRDQRAARRDVGREAAGPDQSSVALVRSILCPGPSPSEAAAARELADRAAAVVETLPEGDREILLLRHTEGLPFDEVAVLLGIDPAAARKRFGRALRRLGDALATHGIEGEIA
ncbi:MAG TPA: sigma-70 family RNA polymerase sigma factor [Gemmataceae bacterium]|nr:sigma-70 family RNA polymerase sigma factor [Gemmataceae bacterium]